MPRNATGEIIQILVDARQVEYKVRLPRGEIVIVPHALVRPARTTPLTAGTRLLVTHELGVVESATTDLSSRQQGVVTAVRAGLGGVTYLLALEDGGELMLSKDKLQPHPAGRSLLVGTEVELRYADRVVVSARPLKETERVRVSEVHLAQKHVTVTGSHSGRHNIRIPPDAIRQIGVGEELDLEIDYGAEGGLRYTLSRPQPAPTGPQAGQPGHGQRAPGDAARRPGGQPRSTPPPVAGSTQAAQAPGAERQAGTQEQPGAAARPTRIEAEAAGLNPLVLEEVRRGQHRFEIVAFLEKHAHDGLIEWYRLKSGRAASFQQPASPLPAGLRGAISRAMPEFSHFFRHQALALDAIRADRNLVIVTQTASGKTLSYNPAIFEYLLANPNGHVLYVFPLNALMMDQLEKINALVAALKTQQVQISVARMMGGLSAEERERAARDCPNIVVTNPEMLGYMLERADRDWRAFFSGLKIIVIDEVHSYRGIFGVHMTGIVRRLLIAARRLGSDPRFVISSATVHNPLDLATRLTALDASEFVLLDDGQDGSQQANKHWLVLNSDWGARGAKFGNYQEVAADVFVELLLSRDAAGRAAPLNTILFCRSMREVRSIKTLVDQRLEQKAPQLKSKVKSYISAALTHDVKREIYNGLRTGSLLGVISTNALEAGIDIGSLDACVIAGFPFSVMAMRQMAGRVGRKKEGLVCFIPIPVSSLDQYYSDHPELLLTQPPEAFVVDPRNPYIARKHINAAAFPGGLSDEDLLRYWGPDAAEITRQAELDGAMRHRAGRWTGTRRDYRAQDDVYNIGNIRSNTQVPYVVCRTATCTLRPECMDPNKKTCDSRVTLLDQQYVYRDCHPGAVYESPDQGLFRVLAVDDAQRAVKVSPLPDDCLERTSVEADIQIELTGPPLDQKTIIPGVEMAWGRATVTRLFTGYHEYTLQPARRCRRCRKEFDETIDSCPVCHRQTERFFNHSKKERKDFPLPYQQGFRIVLNTVASWLVVQPSIESSLDACSPCKLPGDQNKVLAWLKQPIKLEALPPRLKLSAAEQDCIRAYHQQASAELAQARLTARETLLFPGVYHQCLLSELRKTTGESRALEIYQAITEYPVTSDLRHICRDCRRSVLLPAMHTLEHAVDARYPSVALGDRSDIGAFTTLGHPATGLPTIFWFDNYEGGLGAAEKIYALFPRLLETGLDAISSCSCTTLEGCPRCTYIPDCGEGNAGLSKPAGTWLLSTLLGRPSRASFAPFIYRKRRAEDFDKAYQANQTAAHEHGLGEEAPAPSTPRDPYQLLRVQRSLHAIVANKAFEVRSREITSESPPVNAEQLNAAYQAILQGKILQDWQPRPGAGPYEILEVLPGASLKMIQQVYRVIALHVHPDANPNQAAWANELMKQINAAYDRVVKEKG